jgi:hypothetical protein
MMDEEEDSTFASKLNSIFDFWWKLSPASKISLLNNSGI